MSRKKKKIKRLTELDIIKKIRKGWGSVKPYTRVIPSKKAYDRKRDKKIGEAI